MRLSELTAKSILKRAFLLAQQALGDVGYETAGQPAFSMVRNYSIARVNVGLKRHDGFKGSLNIPKLVGTIQLNDLRLGIYIYADDSQPRYHLRDGLDESSPSLANSKSPAELAEVLASWEPI